ncbi:MAG: hypothetical protein K9M99_06070 [Candidatus Cloacimonetes bacterium]|nr:hypothetical protein [Candidatus Cloacimonadota bacterium]
MSRRNCYCSKNKIDTYCCIAKTWNSLSDNPKLPGRRKNNPGYGNIDGLFYLSFVNPVNIVNSVNQAMAINTFSFTLTGNTDLYS